MIVEACVESIEAAIAAEQSGADRVELCMGMAEGGTTPSIGMIRLARERLRIPLHVIIRPRGGDFCYSELELETMLRDIQAAGQAGVDAIVTGALRGDGAVDARQMQRLMEAADSMSTTFHRAFDMTRDPHEALETLVELGVERILTSGQQPSVMEGLELVRELIERAKGRLVVMPGGGITEDNVQEIATRTGASELHIRAAGVRTSPMKFRNPRLSLSGGIRPGDFELPAIHSPRLESCLRLLRKTKRSE